MSLAAAGRLPPAEDDKAALLFGSQQADYSNVPRDREILSTFGITALTLEQRFGDIAYSQGIFRVKITKPGLLNVHSLPT